MEEKKSSPLLPDWSQLPKELLEIITDNMNCFDLVHARSVCTSWRSTFPFPSSLLRPNYSLPTFDKLSLKTNEEEGGGSYTLGKIPYFLFRVRPHAAGSPSEYFFGGIGRDESEELSRPMQCSVKVEIQGSDPTFMKMNDCQIFPLGHRYRIFGWKLEDYRDAAFLPLHKEGEFVVLLNYSCGKLMVLISAEMKWKPFENLPGTLCLNVVTFRGRFYASFLSKRTVVIDPHSLEVADLMPLPQRNLNFLVPSGDDELFLVEVTVTEFEELDFNRFTCNVSRLDEEAGKWVRVSDLGDRVLFIARLGNVSCSAKELPDGCGVSGNSIVFTNWPEDVAFFYKYGPYQGSGEENIWSTVWRTSRENRVVILNTFPVVALRIEP
ncbi:F-box domain-containing protein [Hirschfeldia incana]|nr:F-box domain-containing protein [Hirschfeldia incana]